MGYCDPLPGLGFGFYFPAGPGGYFDFAKNGVYEAHLRLGFLIGGRRFWGSEDFRPGQLSSPYHSKNLFGYAFVVETAHVEHFSSSRRACPRWSSLVLPYLESLWVAGEMQLLSQVVQTIAERVYTSTDRRSVPSVFATIGDANNISGARQKLGWPGVICEIWGSEGAYGGERYGWGAVLPRPLTFGAVEWP